MNFSDSQDPTQRPRFSKNIKNNLRLIYLGKIAIFADTNGCYICL